MDLATLEREHPDLLAEVRAQARAAALTETRELIGQHMRFGDRARDAGGMRRAHKAILALEPMTPELMEEYLGFALNQRQIDDRQEDSDASGAVVDGTAPRRNDQTALANEIDRQLGGAQ